MQYKPNYKKGEDKKGLSKTVDSACREVKELSNSVGLRKNA